MIAKDVQELAYEYCGRGVPLQFHVYSGSNHVQAAPQFEAQTVQFLNALYAGQSVTNECGSLGPGNPLTPLPMPSSRRTGATRILLRAARVNHRLRGLAIVLATNRGTVSRVTVELQRGRRVLAHRALARLGRRSRRLVLRVRGGIPPPGRYTLVVLVAHRHALRHRILIRR